MIRSLRAAWQRSSFVAQIAILFLAIWLIPMLVLSVINRDFTMSEMNQKIVGFSAVSLRQASQNIDNRLKSYEQALLQLTYSDTFLTEISRFNDVLSEQATATARNYLVRTMRTFALSHEYVRNILLVTNKGYCAYDRSVESINDAYLRNFPTSITGLDIDGYNYSRWLPTRYLYTPAKEPYYVMTLRLKVSNIYDRSAYGTMVMSIDASMLSEVCSYSLVSDDIRDHFIAILDSSGSVVYHHDTSLYGQSANAFLDEQTLSAVLARTAPDNPVSARIGGRDFVLSAADIPQTGWYMVSALSRDYLDHELMISQRILTVVIALQLLLLFTTLWMITHTLSTFTRKLVGTMDMAPDVNFAVRIDGTGQNEIAMIADHFNNMMATINRLMIDLENQTEKVRQAVRKGKEAEIRALEAQINPHFLYNTLDSINWMAIENNQYEISDMLSVLAALLRYSIQDSNKLVRIEEEANYLVNYLRIQKYRYSDNFDYLVDTEARVRGYFTYKLLFQPLIENVLLHAFSDVTHGGLIKISFREASDGRVCFSLCDNGKGMTQEMADKLFHSDAHTGIGISNVLARLRLYYGDRCEIQVAGVPDKGLSVCVYFPRMTELREETNDA